MTTPAHTPPTTPAPIVHELKSWPEYFEAMLTGRKTFEFRRRDRRFEVGDLLRLREWKPEARGAVNLLGHYTGREAIYRVTYLMDHATGGLVGCPEGFCVMAVVPV